jgi:hypothetical protein
VNKWQPVDWIVGGLLIVYGSGILLAAVIDVQDTGVAERVLAGMIGIISAYVGARIGSNAE